MHTLVFGPPPPESGRRRRRCRRAAPPTAAARPPPPAGRSRPPAERPCTLYVGKIAEGLGDDAMQALLEACGALTHWKRTVDVVSGRPKAFGFADFGSGEAVLRAMRLLATLRLLGAELLLKVDAKTQEFLTAYEPAFARTPTGRASRRRRPKG